MASKKSIEQAEKVVQEAAQRPDEMRKAYLAAELAPQPADERPDNMQCKICSHPRREGIETLAIVSLGNWAETTRTVNRNFGTDISQVSLKNHMTKHRISSQVRRVGLALSDVQGNDPLLTAHGIIKVLLAQALTDVAAGRIRAKDVNQVIALANMDMKMSGEDDDGGNDVTAVQQDMYRQISVIADLLRAKLTQDQLRDFMEAAGQYNLKMNLVPGILEPMEDPMQLAVEDMRTMGHKRTRRELIEAGVFDESLAEVVGDQE